MIALKAVSLIFVALKEGIEPEPETARPIDGFEFFHFMLPSEPFTEKS